MLPKLLITKSTSPEEITNLIHNLREQKGKEKEVLALIDRSLVFGHEFVINLFFEEALTYQHFYMLDRSDKQNLINMEKSLLKASFYINKYNLVGWRSRLLRFLGKIEEYKDNYKKSLDYFNQSIKFIKSDPEPFRILELNGFLASAYIGSGEYTKGLLLAKKTYNQFFKSKVGKDLKQKDYQTWAIWLSGIVIRVINLLINKKIIFNKKEMKQWLNQVEIYLKPKSKFSYRLGELREVSLKLD